MGIDDFKQKVQEMWGKIGLDNNSPQKIKTLLQYIKELCAHAFEEPNIDPAFEKEIKDTLFKVENEMAKFKKATSSVGPSQPKSNLPDAQSPIQEISSTSNQFTSSRPNLDNNMLSSVAAGGWDPNSSPVLRRLKMGGSLISKSKSNSSPKQVSVVDQTSEPIAAVPDIIPAAIPKTSESTDEIAASLTPFPITPFPGTEPAKPQISSAYLEFPLLKSKLSLEFNDSIVQLGRQDLMNIQSSVKIPDDFYSPILEKYEGTQTEHCIIEQPEKNTFILKDRNNSQKTFFNNTFVTSEGHSIKDGDKFILPVLINNQTSSLDVIFHIEKEA
jgi:FHA domain-containing protein